MSVNADFVNQGIQFRTVYQLVAEITALFERLVAELPAGTAIVHVRHVTLGTVIEVKPTNPACANFDVLTDDFEPYSFGIGRSRWSLRWERRGFRWEPRYRKGEKDILTEIEEMARAVIAGNCEQRRGPFWLIGKIHVGGYTYKMMDLAILPISPFWTHHYAPFVTIANRLP